MTLLELIKRYKKGFSFIAALVIIENVAWIVEPSIFGKLIDALIDKVSSGSKVTGFMLTLPLFLWIGVYIINSGSGIMRRFFEPKIFRNMYVEIIASIVTHSKENKIDISKTAGRAQLSEEYITFFQYRLPEIAEQCIAIVGAVIALATYDYRIFLTCILVAAPLAIAARIYNNKVSMLQKELHDNFEFAYDTLANKEVSEIKKFYSGMAGLHQRIAAWGSFNFGFMRFVLLLVFIAVLYISIDMDDFTTGSIYSIVAYLWTFLTSIEYIPDLMENWLSLRDISARLSESTSPTTDDINEPEIKK
jgi:ABC-type multidrug transport system fused ATPase/permease subunit